MRILISGSARKSRYSGIVTLSVPKGSIYGFIGANGAGKSTTMRAILGVYPEVNPAVKIFGEGIDTAYPAAFIRIGTLIDYPAFYDHLSGWNNLLTLATLRELPRENIREALELTGMWEARHIKMKRYSLGMKQRLAIAMALLSKPELLILDEPVNGLDPNGMVEIRELLVDLNKKTGTTIFISSHLLQELEKMVSHLAIISDGQIMFQGTKADLQAHYGFNKVEFSLNQASQFLSFIDPKFNPVLVNESTFAVDTSLREDIAAINRTLVENGASVYRVASTEGFEKWFMEITKKN
ncbi:MAG: ATP-binding cassette domain-containing protein [Leadbetterella sp.]|nr:ATP-binding cassette domain-containing protein [Leadbetterella sp.]